MAVATLRLNNGIDIPRLGLGVYRTPPGDATREAVLSALRMGYRHIDTARVYGNEESVGQALADSELRREDVFITTKLWNDDQGYEATLRAYEHSRRALGVRVVDLYLIHWPVPRVRKDSWRALEQLLADGRCRAIGVSNYMVQHLDELLADCRVPPAVNQIELSPFCFGSRRAVLELCARHRIAIEAYSPLTKGRKLRDSTLVEVAGRSGRTTAQVLIRWAVQHDFAVLPKSVRPERIRANGEVFDFELSAGDMARLDGLDENLLTSWDPTDAP